ncbi:FUSC family protein [Flavobacterium laiguense]|uniref:FUSC family protein n=1 Tax=Flavobacterium laiguense TaxID=2169409 RepID=A0A2U1K1E8_9FLAO|nr:FUSC family protein [Flavobacterium laiguense]PWA10788.1 FUSC family protein [Flavobacterium laiguense]
MKSFKHLFLQEIKAFYKIKQTDRLWHIPVLASLCIGIPLLTGLYLENLKYGLIASLSGLVILYIPTSSSITNRMITLLICSFGFMFSYSIGLLFSFHPLLSAILFGLYSFVVHWAILFFKTKPPGSFFFIMLTSISSCIPHNLREIPEKIGLITIGTVLACILALIYSLLTRKSNNKPKTITSSFAKNKYTALIEAAIVGFFMFLSLQLGHFLILKNPYWIPISCLAIMQGASLYYIWQRVIHRIIGTLIGLGLFWIIISIDRTPLSICISIIVLQFIIEFLIVRNYILAVIFITPMALLLTEAANPLIHDPNLLISIRFTDIILGSLLGAIGGWLIYNERIKYHAIKNLRKIRRFKNTQ